MPNALVPGHGPNSLLMPVHLGEATPASFRVFDRWGVEVFSSTQMAQGRDGACKGVPQPMGVYLYQVTAKTYQGRPFYKQGHVTLIR